MNVYVTGFGCISSIGLNVEENLNNLRLMKDGLGRSSFLESKYASEKYFGEIQLSTEQLCQDLNLEHVPGLTRTDLLAFKAFDEAIKMAKLSASDISAYDTAFISATTVGGMCLTDQLYRDSNSISEKSDYVSSYGGSAHTLQVAKYYQIKGYTDTINTACSSSSNAIMIGMRLIKSGRAKRVIVGGAESLAKYTVNGFNSLQILSDAKCLPFDTERVGLNLGEAAAYLVLEAEDVLNGKDIFAKVVGAGNSNDSFHSSAMSDEAIGVRKCMESALIDASISPCQIGYVNAHGTGTPNNDFVEIVGLKEIFSNIPYYSSTKSYTGHTLGASGALEAVYTVLSLLNQEVYPNLRTANFMEYTDTLVLECTKVQNLNYAMTNSYGFGGNCTSLIFQKV